ncbi:MAG TPA: PA14 domain-containing protein [Planctomycetota bacterium]|jgi:hypothetical protein
MPTINRGAYYVFAIALAMLTVSEPLLATTSADYAVQVSATVQVSPPSITLSWPAGADATGFTVYRKAPGSTSWGSGTGLGMSTTYTDSNVSVGSCYEYQIVKNTGAGYTGYGYITAGIQVPLVDSRGKIVLIVDNTYCSPLATQLAQLVQDIQGDGWTVLRHDVSRTAKVTDIKSLITSDYNSDPGNVKCVFLFGHVPVPYSGDTAWDGHVPQHVGAWASDTFYGTMSGSWTDSTVNDSGASFSENYNVPGDGKYDQSYIPADATLGVGRVDLYNLPSFSKTDVQLLQQYLSKDHGFRTCQFSVQRRGAVLDNFGTFNGEAFASDGYRNFAPMFGASNVTTVSPGNYFNTVNSQPYLWSYGCGAGTVTSCYGVGGTSDMASNSPQTVFTMFFGSYFGDFDKGDNFLRSPLASAGYILTCSWGGRPQWYYHPMAMGETIGACAKLSQNNNGLYWKGNSGARGTHVCLMGDPTLRMHPVAPPSSLTLSGSNPTTLSWTASSDACVGYHVYRATTASGTFTRLSSSLITGTSFVDTTGSISNTYMVRAVKLESSGSGTYYNASQGAFSGAPVTPPPPPAGTGNGLLGTYFTNADLTGTTYTRIDPTVNFNWNGAVPISGLSGTNFSVRWAGQVQPQYSETYTFYTSSDDGVRLWVNGQQLINNWTAHATTENSGTIALTAGQKYDIKMEYYQGTGGSCAMLSWSSLSTFKAIIPQTQLYAAASTPTVNPVVGTGDGLYGTYFANIDLTGTTANRVDTTINFNWNGASPISPCGGTNWSGRWTGQIEAQFSETYTLYTSSDDGVRMWINGTQVINNWTSHATTENSCTIPMVAGQMYDVQLEYFQGTGGSVLTLSWSSPSTNKCIIPQTQLYSYGSSIVTPPTPTVGTGDGLLGAYFANATLSGTPATRVDPTVNFNWNGASPISGLAGTNFSTRWNGQVQAQFSETYTFYTCSDDGVRLWVNGVQIINDWTYHASTVDSGTIALTAGQQYTIQMEYFQGTGGAVATLSWSSPSTPKAIIPQTQLYSGSTSTTTPPPSTTPPPPPSTTPPPPTASGTGLLGSYFNNTYLTGTPVTRTDATIDFVWTTTGPIAGFPLTNYSVRWTGFVQPQFSETYTFTTTSDDGVRLYVNGQKIIDNWTGHAATTNTGTIALTAGQKVAITLEYYQGSHDAVIKLQWNSPSTPLAVVPQSQLCPQ